MNFKKLIKSEHTNGKQLCARRDGRDYWNLAVKSVEECLNSCKTHEHCQKANYYTKNDFENPLFKGNCLMYPIGAEKCGGLVPDIWGEPDISIQCVPKRCRHGKNKHDCLKDTGPDGAFCHYSWQEGENLIANAYRQNKMRCSPCKNGENHKLGFR